MPSSRKPYISDAEAARIDASLRPGEYAMRAPSESSWRRQKQREREEYDRTHQLLPAGGNAVPPRYSPEGRLNAAAVDALNTASMIVNPVIRAAPYVMSSARDAAAERRRFSDAVDRKGAMDALFGGEGEALAGSMLALGMALPVSPVRSVKPVRSVTPSTAVGFPRLRRMETPQIATTAVATRPQAAPRSIPEVIDLNPNLSMGVKDSAGRFHSYAEVRADAARFAEEAAARQANKEFLAAAQERATRLQIQGDRQAMAQARGGTHDPKFARTHSESTLVVPPNGGPAVEFAPAPVQGRVSHWVDLFRRGRQTKDVAKAEASVKTAQSQLSKFDEGIAKLAADGKIDATSPAVAAKRQAFEARVSSAQSKQLAAEGKLQATEQRLSDYARGAAAHADAVGQAARAARSPWEYGFGKWDPQLMPGSWKVKAAVGTGLFTAGAGMYGAYRQAQTRAETAEAVLQDRQVAGDLFNQIESKYLGDPVNTRAILASDDSFRQFHEMVATAAAATYKANHENDPVVRKSLRESIDRRRAAIDERLRNSAPALYRDRIEYLRDSQTTLPGPEAWYDQTDAQADAARGGR